MKPRKELVDTSARSAQVRRFDLAAEQRQRRSVIREELMHDPAIGAQVLAASSIALENTQVEAEIQECN